MPRGLMRERQTSDIRKACCQAQLCARVNQPVLALDLACNQSHLKDTINGEPVHPITRSLPLCLYDVLLSRIRPGALR